MDAIRLDYLLNQYVDEGLLVEERQELESQLLQSAEARQLFWSKILFHGLIRDCYEELSIQKDLDSAWNCSMADSDSLPIPEHTTSGSLASATDPDLFSTEAAPPAFPLLGTLGNAWSGTVGFFSQEVPFSLLVATVITALGLWGSSLIYVSQRQSIATTNRPPASVPAPSNDRQEQSYVGQITGMVNCKGQLKGVGTRGLEFHATNNLTSHIALGDQFILSSGLMEITYDTGAKVILQGPVTYEVDSPDGGFLSVGKLTARLEKRGEWREESSEKVVSGQPTVASSQWSVASETNPEIPKSPIPNPSSSPAPRPQSPAPVFAVRTPTAVVTDLGTEFGVYVAANGSTQVHVLQGAVEACALNSPGNRPMHQCIIEGNAMKIDRKEQALTTIRYAPHLFARKMPDSSAQPLCETLYRKIVLADEPLGYWPLSEPAGSRKFTDLSGNGFHGYAMNKVSAGLPGPLGNNSRSLELDGISGYVDIGRHDEFALANNLTVESWLWIKDIGVQAKVVSACKSTIAGGDGVGWALHLGRKNFSMNLQDPITIDWTTYWVYADMWFSLRQNDVPIKQWLHVAVVFDGSNTAHLYLNGTPCGKIVGSKPANVGPVWVEIGRGDVSTGFWNGRLAHVAVYPRSLPAEIIRKHYQTAIQLQSTASPKD